jgi:acetyl-CoA carboxylase biotin carboxyl carrier protein
MNEIEAEIQGIVVAKHLENGRPVEYGESLFTIQPL